MNDLYPELQMLIDAQPQLVREAFQYCLALMMVENGSAELVNTVPGEAGSICYFETVGGESFAIPRPSMTQGQEAEIIEALREIMRDEQESKDDLRH